jgi:hypothetical protein
MGINKKYNSWDIICIVEKWGCWCNQHIWGGVSTNYRHQYISNKLIFGVVSKSEIPARSPQWDINFRNITL